MEEQTELVSSISCLERVLTVLIYQLYKFNAQKIVPPDMIASAHRLFKLSPTYVIHRAATNVWIPTTLMKKSHALLLQDDDGGRNML